MADRLLMGLIDYHESVTKHVQDLEQEFESLTREWRRFESVYEGDAAAEFKNLWHKSSANFQDYMERSRRILAVLEERISFLQEANRPSS